MNLFNKYLLLVTFETDDNYSIRFEMKNTICTVTYTHIRCTCCFLISSLQIFFYIYFIVHIFWKSWKIPLKENSSSSSFLAVVNSWLVLWYAMFSSAFPFCAKFSFASQVFCVFSPNNWNSLPLHIRSSDSLASFKSRLKSHLFCSAYLV